MACQFIIFGMCYVKNSRWLKYASAWSFENKVKFKNQAVLKFPSIKPGANKCIAYCSNLDIDFLRSLFLR